ncbi:hypothetical protein HPB50_013060 [Hyalomma asiaticum]|uniref:Uncharacterized protein n=1 Tax=Hyalomma asiaticum TaxID=266040 RepID=A0ACB7SPW9_HYAAI|nr:hypothetical protein HPB50_013060 [Hyalomma asiaticum]
MAVAERMGLEGEELRAWSDDQEAWARDERAAEREGSGRDCSRSRPRCPGFDSGPEPPVEGGIFRVVITSSERASVGKQPRFLRGQELPRLPPSVDVLVSA